MVEIQVSRAWRARQLAVISMHRLSPLQVSFIIINEGQYWVTYASFQGVLTWHLTPLDRRWLSKDIPPHHCIYEDRGQLSFHRHSGSLSSKNQHSSKFNSNPFHQSKKSILYNQTLKTNTFDMQFSSLATLLVAASAAVYANPLDLEKGTNQKANEYTSMWQNLQHEIAKIGHPLTILFHRP